MDAKELLFRVQSATESNAKYNYRPLSPVDPETCYKIPANEGNRNGSPWVPKVKRHGRQSHERSPSRSPTRRMMSPISPGSNIGPETPQSASVKKSPPRGSLADFCPGRNEDEYETSRANRGLELTLEAGKHQHKHRNHHHHHNHPHNSTPHSQNSNNHHASSSASPYSHATLHNHAYPSHHGHHHHNRRRKHHHLHKAYRGKYPAQPTEVEVMDAYMGPALKGLRNFSVDIDAPLEVVGNEEQKKFFRIKEEEEISVQHAAQQAAKHAADRWALKRNHRW